MDDPIFKQKYEKYKLRVKVWEKEFKKKHGRVPSKYDIREAPAEIRDSYKMYYKLKTSFLEDTLNDVLSEDGFDVLEFSQSDSVVALSDNMNDSVSDAPSLPFDIAGLANSDRSSPAGEAFSNVKDLPSMSAISNLVNLNENHVIKEFEAIEHLELNEKAWNDKVSKKVVIPTASLEKKSIKKGLNPKLFMSAVPKRNPRKPLMRTNLNATVSSEQINPQSGAVLPDFETILIERAKKHKAAAALASNFQTENAKETIKTQLDDGWLTRIGAQTEFQGETPYVGHTTGVVSSGKSHYGLANVDISKIVKADEATTKEVQLSVNVPLVEESLLHGETLNTYSVADSMVLHSKKLSVKSDSDSVVSDSGAEDEPLNCRHIVKRRRVLASVNQNVESNDVQDKKVHAYENEVTTRKTASTAVLIDAEQAIESIKSATPPTDLNTSGDFSADNDKDPDYAADKSVNNRRKVTSKRTKQVKTTSSKPRKNEVKRERKVKEGPTRKAAREKKSLATRTGKKPKNNAKTEVENTEATTEVEEQPPNPQDLKYTLALESGDFTAIPRANFADLEVADTVAQRYINTTTVVANAAAGSSKIVVNDRRAAARKKLEEKIASGKLNENFVTINIQKKKFARGKKTINFARYKKNLWKSKKRAAAALTGPNMNMGGCDGGVMTCFNCGQPGHFAQNCKIKGDTLLPLTAQLEEDPSPFPTLEEAERMAAHSALSAHSNNLTKLPAATNSAIYRPEDETNETSSDDSSDCGLDSMHNTDEEARLGSDEELINIDMDAAIASAEKTVSPIKQYVGHKIPQDFLKKAGLDTEDIQTAKQHGNVDGLYDLNDDGSVKEVTPEVLEALHLFGHTSFRKGQDRAVMRILSGLSTLVTLSTGSGKSLCYQLPAYLYSRKKKSITLVISPLVSLMEDQVTGVPHFLRAHCLHTNQTPQQRLKVMQMISNGEVDVLLVSPEAVVAGERATGFGSILRQLPPIAFACIDEAHCVSQWSHNFRPSYLMICKVLRKNLGVRTVLGLTATATLPTRVSIINHLGIPDGERGIISDIPLPDNLILSVSKDENRDAALLELLMSQRFAGCQSIIIYCTRRDECERIAGFLRTYMQDYKTEAPVTEGGKKKRKRVNWHAEPYHAGMPSSRRRTIQKAFMSNELRIVVATIAFGMGINKPDIRAIIHYNMPRNFESYVQEIGRAGRDGKVAHCHLFLDAHRQDQNELRRHIYANSIDRHVIRKLLQRIFVPCSCDKNLQNPAAVSFRASEDQSGRQHICPGHEIGFSVDKTVENLDIPAENISTLLCYMELEEHWHISVLSSAYIMAKVISYGGAKYLKYAAKECPPLAMAIALEIEKKHFKEDANVIEFSVVDIAAAIGWHSGVVKYQLKNLEWVQVNGVSRRSPITVSFYDLGFRIKAPGDFTAEEIDDALDSLYERSVKQEQTQLMQLQYVFQGLSSVAYNTYVPCSIENFSHVRSDQLKGIIRDYFRNDYPKDLKLEIEAKSVPDEHIENDVHAMMNMYPDNNFSGRVIARIFYGISSPNYPAVMWGRCKFWRAHSKVDFNRIVQLANAVLVKRRLV